MVFILYIIVTYCVLISRRNIVFYSILSKKCVQLCTGQYNKIFHKNTTFIDVFDKQKKTPQDSCERKLPDNNYMPNL